MTKFRKGDRVTVPGVVADVDGQLVNVEIRNDEPGAYCREVYVAVSPDTLTLVERAPPKVGDCVIHKDNPSETYNVLAVDALSAWVRSEVGHMYQTVLLSNLTVVRRC
jgi:hypothetical protein